MSLSDAMLGASLRMGMAGLSLATPRPLSILLFHRVLPVTDPLFPLELDAQRFDRLMGLVARSFRVLRLADAVNHLAHGTLPERALCITFDDGYADNHDIALPILQRHGLSACFFIATGFLDGGGMFNDSVIECLRHSPLPSVDLTDFGLHRFPLTTPAERAAAIGAVLPKIKYLPPDQRPQAVERLRSLCQTATPRGDLMMTRRQVQALRACGMEIGAHTVHHPILTSVSDVRAEQEIAQSREVLQDLIDQPVTLFAYPNGRPDADYAHRHVQMVTRLGFSAAVSTAPGVAQSGADLFQLPRFTPWDRSAWPWIGRLAASRREPRFDVAKAPST